MYGQEDRTIYDQVDREITRDWLDERRGWDPTREIDGPSMDDIYESNMRSQAATDPGPGPRKRVNPNLNQEEFEE